MTLVMLSLIPLIFSLAIGLTIVGIHLREYHKRQTSCRSLLVNTQNRLGSILENLLALNPEARKLRAQRKLAERNLARAIKTANPLLIKAAAAQLAIVTVLQLKLKAQQTALLARAQSHVEEVYTSFKQTVGTTQLHYPSAWPGLAVFAQPPTSLSPDYILKPNFKNQQTLEAQWKIHMHAHVPDFLRLIPIQRWHLKGQCAASLKKSGPKWQPILAAAKF